MDIIIEEQHKVTDWIPPTHSGLDNSKEIISSSYFRNDNNINTIDFFQVIKDDILNNRTLTERQLNYIKNLDNEDKFELIEIYNKILDKRRDYK
jgi:hypothetical protein